ncbi:MAG: hypothetical protein R3B68_16225 [Phycisphaerales bacterium]|mgnify:CR=1 FL=1
MHESEWSIDPDHPSNAGAEWAKGVPIDRVWFVASLLLRANERGSCRILKAVGTFAPEHAVRPREMRLAVSFLHRLGYGVADVVDEGKVWVARQWTGEPS